MKKLLSGRILGVFAMSLCFAMAVGCSEDNGDKDAGSSDTASTDAGGTTDGGTSKDVATSTDAGSNDAGVAADGYDPNRDKACGKFDDGMYGKKTAWQGFAHKTFKFTCNSCRGGYPNVVGKWRLVDGKTEDPRVPLKSKDGTAYAEHLEFDGNHWTNTIVGTDLGKEVTATIDGWYFCSDKAELAGAPAVFIQKTVKPEGAFGNTSDSVWRADILTSGKNRLLLGDVGFASLDKAGTDDFAYCRIGSTVDVEGKQVPCSDPGK